MIADSTSDGDERAATTREQDGHWEAVIRLPNVPVHSHLLPNGKVLFWGRRVDLKGDMDQQQCDVYLLDPNTAETHKVSSPTLPDESPVNLFCSGHALLADGRLFVAGGHLTDGHGVNQASLYDWEHDAWTPLPPMNHGRWYPTVTLLADGGVLVTSGTFAEGAGPVQLNDVPQIWSAETGWRSLNGEVLSLYPRMHVLANDRVFVAGTDPVSHVLDPRSGEWSSAPNRANGDRQYAPAVSYAPGKIIYIGGGNDPPTNVPTARSEIIDFDENNAAWQATMPMSQPRRQHNATVLPDGTVLVTGGTKGGGFDGGFNDLGPGQPVHEAELWSPSNGHWTPLAAEAEDRCYHSTALLLPDGRVLSAGGGEYNPNGNPIRAEDVHTSAQIFNPPYLFRGARPIIDGAPVQAEYGTDVVIRCSGAPPLRATLVKPGSVTHSLDTNQRCVELKLATNGKQATLTLPANSAICPPGFYMMFLLSAEGVPSVAHFIRLERPAADTVTFAANSQSANKPSLADRDRRIEAEARGPKVVIGLTSRCPYGLAACWGGAYQTLRTLSGVGAVKAVANADDSTAEVFLRDNAPPDIDGWIATF
ncbi:MAG: DUF1929 domain-containing protein, partial [Bradyrhizobium sp.]|uniref:galactose oxidase-like domain-containing protein n=1 Tax=Bradyrhizobium sp. TaxID=376 RepID=UPI001DDF0DD3